MDIKVNYISAACNCTYNCMELAEDFIIYGSNKALAIYDLKEEKVRSTVYAHNGRVNCVRFVKNCDTRFDWAISCCSGGSLILWQQKQENSFIEYSPKIRQHDPEACYTVCDGIQSGSSFLIGCISSVSEILLYSTTPDGEFQPLQEIQLASSLSNDLIFHAFDENSIVLALGLDTGAVALYEYGESGQFTPSLTLSKHDDWVRCINFITLENGDTLMASGGQDSFIAVWKFTKSVAEQSSFEFQVHQFKDYSVLFDSMIIGHEGWINSLHFNSEGELLSCSSDQSIIIWENLGEIWMEKTRLGVIGGMVPGGCCAKYYGNRVISSGFQGAVQIWSYNQSDGEWEIRPSITGHFLPITDMDYDRDGNYIVSTSEDQTTRVHAPWASTSTSGRWHEISRPQIHGHDLFACRTIEDMIVSGAEEKILRAFQPTEIFYKNLEDTSDIFVERKNEAAKAAFIPSLGLSNQTEDSQINASALDLPIETRLDDDFIRSQTLWLEVSKLYGHVYEIACIATSPKDPLIASASQATKQQFAAIILWCSKRWKNLGEFPFHKLNVTGMEFCPDGSRLLSVSRDRTWAVWNIFRKQKEDFSMEVLTSGGIHSRALWVGSWGPQGKYFVTGARDKKLIVWARRINDEDSKETYEQEVTETFHTSVSSASVNEDGLIAVGLESGEIQIYQYSPSELKLKCLCKLDNSFAHHETVRRLQFNPRNKSQLASSGSDHILKIYQL